MSLENTLRFIEKLIPAPLFRALLPLYHWLLAFSGALIYRMPSSKITVIGVTGTKGKSSVIEMASAIFEEAGYKTALANTIRVKVGKTSEPNMRKLSLPGRFFVQRFLRRAVRDKCDIAFVEMTSEGVPQHRHRFLALDALIFTGLHKEHIEAHGSFEKYAEAKLQMGRQLVRSGKRPRTIIANADSPYGERFLALPVENKEPFRLRATEPYSTREDGVVFSFGGANIRVSLPGTFTICNALSAATLARVFEIPHEKIARALARIKTIPGRTEAINEGQVFTAIIDYAHTPDSLRALYEAYEGKRKICVLGSTGGGRDKWKRPEMGKIAEEYCAHVILTDEDPYDEDPRAIVEEIAGGMSTKPTILMNRREAIEKALSLAQAGDAVLITGKGTDPYIMRARGERELWSDAGVTRTALKALVDSQKRM